MPRRLARLLGGELYVTDRGAATVTSAGAPQHGVCFSLRLPLRVAGALPPPPRELREQLSPVTVDSLSGGAMLVRRNVLLVDDGPGNRRLARRMLQQIGCAVTEAADGDEVLHVLFAAAAGGPGAATDVVLMNVHMPRLDGIAALKEMRAAGWAIPVIAVTADADADAEHGGDKCAFSRARGPSWCMSHRCQSG